MNLQNIKFETAGEIGTITLDQPQKRNALSLRLLQELIYILDQLKDNFELKVIILKGGGGIFSSGHDLTEMINRDLSDYAEIFQACSHFMLKIQDMPQTFIAQVNGVATAAGCQLVAACDLALAEENALFGTPGVKIGLFCSTPAIPLLRAVGRKLALEMLLTGRMITATEAVQHGLINRVVPSGRLETETIAVAQKIAEASLLTLSIGKKAFYQQANMTDKDAYTYGSGVMLENIAVRDAQEGIDAFLTKRKPTWENR